MVDQTIDLMSFRKKIDNIDTKIVSLLKERLDIVKEVKNYKLSNNESFFIKSARESDMINKLIRDNKELPPEIIFSIWRKIISFSNFIEQKIRVVLYNPYNCYVNRDIVVNYYNELIEIEEITNIKDLIENIENNSVQIFAFPLLTNNQNIYWWEKLYLKYHDIRIFCKIPTNKERHIFLAARKNDEKSLHDNTLLVVNANKKTIHEVLRIGYNIYQSKDNLNLISIKNHLDCKKVKLYLNDIKCRILGYYSSNNF